MLNGSNEVTAAEIIRNFGFWQAKALVEPVIVTHHGRPRLAITSVEAFDILRSSAATAEGAPARAAKPDPVVPALMTHMAEGFVAYDEDLRFTVVNPAAETFMVRSREELIGRRFSEIFPAHLDGIIHDRLRRTLATGQSYHFEAATASRPGLRVSVTTFPYSGGVGAVFLNTTEQDRLGQNQDCYRAVMDALTAHDAVAVARLDSRGRIEEVQAEFADWLGLAPREMTNVRLYDFAPSKDRRRLQDTLEAVWETHSPQTIEADFMRREDSDLALRLTFSAVVHDFAVQSLVVVATRAGVAKSAG